MRSVAARKVRTAAAIYRLTPGARRYLCSEIQVWPRRSESVTHILRWLRGDRREFARVRPPRVSRHRDAHDMIRDVRRVVLVLVCAALLGAACRDRRPPTPAATVVWRPLGSWSGRGPTQTDPFISDTGSLRLRWQTVDAAGAGQGTFRVTLHSDVSGRPLVLAVDARGAGRDVVYVTEDPRSFFLAVEARDVEWTLAADEAVPATSLKTR